MTDLLGYVVFQITPTAGALFYTLYLAYVLADPTRLKKRLSMFKGQRLQLQRKFYNKYSLGAWICITLFFVSGIVYDLYMSAYTLPSFVVFLHLLLVFALIFVGSSLMLRALKR
jgi:hypothetical protein